MSLTVFKKKYKILDGSFKELIKRIGDGSIIKRFDKTPYPEKPQDIVCPHFLELKWATGCPFNCAWCYLQGTLRFPPRYKKPYVKNYDKIEKHIKALLNSDGEGGLLNSGELADSLMHEDNDNPFSTFITSLLKGQDKYKILFVTKSTDINNLLKIEAQDRVIISYSLNSFKVAKIWERGAPPVIDRIKAIRKLYKAGYEIRVRIDPIVPIGSWIMYYRDLIDCILEVFIPSRITLGTLRGLRSTINMAKKNRNASWIKFLSEKTNFGMRISEHLRELIYSSLIEYLRDSHYEGDIGMCKETLDIWNKLGMDYKEIRCNCIL